MKTLFDQIVKEMIEQKLTISSCESFTGGMFANEITNIPNSSKVFKGSFISYSNEMKINIVKISKRIIKKYSVVSKECSEQMAINTKKKIKTNISVSFTGNAGPGVCDNKTSVGLAFITIIFNDVINTFEIHRPDLNREEFKSFSVNFAAEKILNCFKK